MFDPYVGDIRLFAGTYAPEGWADCNGQLLSTSKYWMLFHLIGTTYGGDGVSTFALPNLQGRLPVGTGTGPRGGTTFSPADSGGVDEVKLTVDELPVHTHPLGATQTFGRSETPASGLLARGDVKLFAEDPPTTALDARTVDPVGWTTPHDNRMPYQVIRFIISLGGMYPTPT